MSRLEIQDIHKSYAGQAALAGVSFNIEQGQATVLLGPSGCGKSTLLAIIAGLEQPDQGQVSWDGQPLAGIPPHRRGFGLMFQDYALFPHMNVQANIAFGLHMQGWAKADIPARVEAVLDLVGLPGLTRRDVNTLSGGEQQRVALARAMAPNPRLLMLDEPLGSLDRSLRERLIADLPAILRRAGQTVLYVTHDQEEAFAIADQVVLLNAGRVEQIGAPQEIYCCPASPFAARFLEMPNLLPAEVHHRAGRITAQTPIGELPLEAGQPGPATLLIRPDAARLDENGPLRLNGQIVSRSFRGHRQRVSVLVEGQPLVFDFASSAILPADGAPITLSLDPSQALRLF